MAVLGFLRKFQENSLLANVTLDLGYGQIYHTLPMLREILPLLSSIYSIDSYQLFDWVNNSETDKEYQLLLKTIVAQTKILTIKWLVRC
jgi:hypothetical protein